MGVVWSAERRNPRHGGNRSALSFLRTDSGLAGSVANKSLTLNVKAVEFPAGPSLDDNENGPDFRPPVRHHEPPNSGLPGRIGPCNKGSPCRSLASWTIRVSPLRSSLCEPGRVGDSGYHDAICSLPLCHHLGQVTGWVSWKHRLCRAKCPQLRQRPSHDCAKTRRGFGSRRRRRVGAPGPQGDAQTMVLTGTWSM